MKTKVLVNINELRVWSDNPRAGLLLSENEELDEKTIINVLVDVVGDDKMFKLAEDIVQNSGLISNILPVVVKKNDSYFVYDGNRRISCIKMLLYPEIIENNNLKNKILKLLKTNIDLKKLYSVEVYETDENEAYLIMDRTHNGENGGIGTIPWDSYQRDVSLVKRNANARYQTAYDISSILGFKTKADFKNMYYTDIDRIFNSKLLKDTFKIEKYTYSEIYKIQEIYNSLMEYKRVMNIKSFSRYFNNTDSSNEDYSSNPMRKFCNWYIERETNKDNYIIKADNVELFEDEAFSLDLLHFSIYDKNGKLIILGLSDEDIIIKYTSPSGKSSRKVDMSFPGEWKIEFIYKGNNIIRTIKIKSLFTPKIELIKDSYVINEGDSLNMEDTFRAYGLHGEDIKEHVTFRALQPSEVEKNIFLGTNPRGSYSYILTYGSISKRIEIIVKENLEPIGTIITNKVFVFDSKIKISFDNTICGLVSEMNDDSFSVSKFPNLFCCSVRSVVELMMKYLSKKSIIKFSKEDFETKIKEMISYYEQYGIKKLCSKYNNIFPSYRNCLNFVKSINVPSMSAILNLGAHTSSQTLDINSLLELCKKTISPLLVYTEYIGKC